MEMVAYFILGVCGVFIVVYIIVAFVRVASREISGQGGDGASQEVRSETRAAYVDEIEKLAALRDKGIITTEEFESKKKQLLDI